MRGNDTAGPLPRDRLIGEVRRLGADYTAVTRAFAAWLGLHPTDAAALTEVLVAEDGGAPLSPARLSEHVGLTSGATTSLVDRLERQGHVVRSREQVDRRIVTLRTSERIREPATAFFAVLTREVDAAVLEMGAADVDAFHRVAERVGQAISEALAHPPPPPAP